MNCEEGQRGRGVGGSRPAGLALGLSTAPGETGSTRMPRHDSFTTKMTLAHEEFVLPENARDPVLRPTPILSLRPTQMTVGMQEVRRKRDAWKAHPAADLSKFLAQHMVPTILGLGGRHYVIDHHHLALALHEEGVESVSSRWRPISAVSPRIISGT